MLEVIYRPTVELIPYANNSRTHSAEQVGQVAASITEFGFTNPVLIDDDGSIIAGHGRVQAAKTLALDEIPTITLAGLTAEQKRAYIIADNQLALTAGWDLDTLKAEIDTLSALDFDIDLLGFDEDFLAGLTDDGQVEGLTDEDDVPDVPETPATVIGDVWVLGNHRLMCGDSTKIDEVERLMDGNKVDITFTSPPYNVGASPLDTHIVAGKKSKSGYKYSNNTDDLSTQEYKTFLNDYTITSLMVSDYVFSNIQSLSGNKIALIEHLYDMREKFADTIIWNKKAAAPAMARKVLNSQFEYIHVFSNEAKRTIGVRDFKGTLFNVIEMTSRKDKELAAIHRATFPVEFAEHFVANFTEATCFDPFGGTGTTLIACEKKHRKCYMMELDPKYCDVIVKRWQAFTGKHAVDENGRSFDEVSNDG
tara:strand:+ start:1671 stop:2936 length:1266 start_codon:yes stop_codon:yes gene_type:complete